MNGAEIRFSVDGAPFGWQRNGYNQSTNRIYKKAETREHQEAVAWAYRRACGAFSFSRDACIAMVVLAYMPIPKSASEKKKQAMLEGKIRPTVKPDWDNIGKLIADALNGIAFDDDKSIVDGRVIKLYGEKPHVEILLKEVGL